MAFLILARILMKQIAIGQSWPHSGNLTLDQFHKAINPKQDPDCAITLRNCRDIEKHTEKMNKYDHTKFFVL